MFFKTHNICLTPLTVYDTTPISEHPEQVIDTLKTPYDAIAFTSPSNVQGFVKTGQKHPRNNSKQFKALQNHQKRQKQPSPFKALPCRGGGVAAAAMAAVAAAGPKEPSFNCVHL